MTAVQAPPVPYRKLFRRRTRYSPRERKELAAWLQARGWQRRPGCGEPLFVLDPDDDWPLTIRDAAREQAARDLYHRLRDRYSLAGGASDAATGEWALIYALRLRTSSRRGRRMSPLEALRREGIE